MQNVNKKERKAEKSYKKATSQPTKKNLIRKHYKDFVKFINDIPFDKLNSE
jgi:hypothetical protein